MRGHHSRAKGKLRLVRKKKGQKRESDFRLGWRHGYETGRREAVIRQVPYSGGVIFEKKVLFVRTGQGIPYAPIDDVIVRELEGLVRDFSVASPDAPIVQMAEQMRPDLVLVLNGCAFFPVDQIEAIRSLGIITAIWLTDDPYYTDMTFEVVPHYDFVFTLELSCVPAYQQLGCPRVHYLPLGVDPGAFRPIPVYNRHRVDICFIGTAYWNRVHLFDRIAPYLSKKNVHISGWWWDRLNAYPLLRKKISPGIWMSPEETAKHYNGAKIVINLHRAFDDTTWNYNSRNIPAYSVNPRTFEIAACGAFQLTDIREDLGSVYVRGSEIADFSSPEELVDKIEYYLKHEEERRDIALRGLFRTMCEHTYRRRLIKLLNEVFGLAVS